MAGRGKPKGAPNNYTENTGGEQHNWTTLATRHIASPAEVSGQFSPVSQSTGSSQAVSAVYVPAQVAAVLQLKIQLGRVTRELYCLQNDLMQVNAVNTPDAQAQAAQIMARMQQLTQDQCALAQALAAHPPTELPDFRGLMALFNNTSSSSSSTL